MKFFGPETGRQKMAHATKTFLRNRHVCMRLKVDLITGGCCLSAVFVLWSLRIGGNSLSMSLTDGISNQILFKGRLKAVVLRQ